MTTLRVGVPYHIQNVDSGKFLELKDRASEAEVKMRPAKQSDKQLWIVVPDRNDPDILLLENVANRSWLGTITDNKQFTQVVGQSRAYAGRWWIVGDNDDGFRQVPILVETRWSGKLSFDSRISLAVFTKANALCLELTEFGVILLQKKKQIDSQKWRFLTHSEAFQTPGSVVSNFLTTGLYRIRSLDGSALLAISEGTTEVESRLKYTGAMAQAVPFGDAQFSCKWAVNLDESGRYTIQDAEQQLFLGSPTYDCYQYGAVHGLKDPFEWELSSIGGFAYSINTNSPSGLLSIGFRDYQVGFDKQLALMPASKAHSQIWFFEPWEEYDFLNEPASRGATSPRSPGVHGGPASPSIPRSGTPLSSGRPHHDYHGPRMSFSGGSVPHAQEDTVQQDRPESDEEDEVRLPNGHYHIRNAGDERYLNMATEAFLKSEPSHAPSRFFVHSRESDEGKYQIVPHSYSGQQSLVCHSSGLEVESGTAFAWRLVHVGGTSYLVQSTSNDGILGVIDDKIDLVERSDSARDDHRVHWDFVFIH